MSRRLEWTTFLIGMVIAAAGIAMFWLSVKGRLFSSPLTLIAAESGVVLAELALVQFVTFLRRRGLG